jgi:predicted TIM-barrel fold metal-dependent hydrolase
VTTTPRPAARSRAPTGSIACCSPSPIRSGSTRCPPPRQAQLLDAWHDGVLALGDPFGVWAAIALADPDPAAVRALLDRGAVGLSLPAGAVGSPEGIERLGPVLAMLEERSAPLFVHPGPAAPAAHPRPAWWPALTDYVASMQAAWLSFLAWGRAAHPDLRVLFAMLAGGGPLQLERLAARGGPVSLAADSGFYYDTSSYGVRTLDATVRAVGIDQIVHGSDRPVADPPPADVLGDAARAAMTSTNPTRLLAGSPVEAGIA